MVRTTIPFYQRACAKRVTSWCIYMYVCASALWNAIMICIKITLLCLYSHKHSRHYWMFAAKVYQVTSVLCYLYGGKHVGGNDNPDLASYGC